MDGFVKLTRRQDKVPIWVNLSRSRTMILGPNGGSVIKFTEDEFTDVTDSPRQIMALINGPADRDALVEALRGERSLVEDAQHILTLYLQPDGRSAERAIESLLQLLDGAHQRAIKAASDAAIAKATGATP